MLKDKKGRNLYKGESQMPDGRYRYRYIDKTGKRKAVYSWRLVPTDRAPEGRKKDTSLREKESQILKDLDDGINLNLQEMTVNDLFLRYIATKVNIANSTKENYLFHWGKDVKDNWLGQMKLKDVRKSHILKFYAHLHEERNLSAGTIQLYQNFLYPAFQMAVEDSIIRINPCNGCMKDYILTADERIPLTKDEESRLLDYVKNSSPYYKKYYTLLVFMLGTGVRIGEALGLTWKDIDFKKGTININHQVVYRKKNDRFQFYISLPKGKKTRDIPMSNLVTKILLAHRTETYILSKHSEYSVDGYSEFVFFNSELKLHKPETIVRAFHGIVEEYNKNSVDPEIRLPDFTPHILRHTFCTRMAEQGMDIKVLQTIMGHKNIAITMQVYNHVNSERARQEMKRLEDFMAM